MSLRFLIGHRRFASQGFFLVFCAAFAAFTLFVIFRPASEVEGQEDKVAPGFTPDISLQGVDKTRVNEGGSFKVTLSISPKLEENHDYRLPRRCAF